MALTALFLGQPLWMWLTFIAAVAVLVADHGAVRIEEAGPPQRRLERPGVLVEHDHVGVAGGGGLLGRLDGRWRRRRDGSLLGGPARRRCPR